MTFPTNEQLALELSWGTVHSWHVNGQLYAIKLSIKYAILHKIGITNWYPSLHVSTISTTLANLIFLICTSFKVDVGDFVFRHVLRHIDTFGINILICFP